MTGVTVDKTTSTRRTSAASTQRRGSGGSQRVRVVVLRDGTEARLPPARARASTSAAVVAHGSSDAGAEKFLRSLRQMLTIVDSSIAGWSEDKGEVFRVRNAGVFGAAVLPVHFTGKAATWRGFKRVAASRGFTVTQAGKVAVFSHATFHRRAKHGGRAATGSTTAAPTSAEVVVRREAEAAARLAKRRMKRAARRKRSRDKRAAQRRSSEAHVSALVNSFAGFSGMGASAGAGTGAWGTAASEAASGTGYTPQAWPDASATAAAAPTTVGAGGFTLAPPSFSMGAVSAAPLAGPGTAPVVVPVPAFLPPEPPVVSYSDVHQAAAQALEAAAVPLPDDDDSDFEAWGSDVSL